MGSHRHVVFARERIGKQWREIGSVDLARHHTLGAGVVVRNVEESELLDLRCTVPVVLVRLEDRSIR